MSRILSTVLELVGFAAVAAGVGMVSVPAGVVVAGLELVFVSFALDGRRGARS
jgi:hypothetical protein